MQTTMQLLSIVTISVHNVTMFGWVAHRFSVRSQQSVHMLSGPVLQQQQQHYKPHRPAVLSEQLHLDLVLVNHSGQPMQAGLTFGSRSFFLFQVFDFYSN